VAVNHYSTLGEATSYVRSAGTEQVFTNAQQVVYATCYFGDSYHVRHVTQVTLQRRAGDNFWVGTVISFYNQ
jgi:hypothetical protein